MRRSSSLLLDEISSSTLCSRLTSELEIVGPLVATSELPMILRFCLYTDGSKPLLLNQDSTARNLCLAARLRYGRNPIIEPNDTYKQYPKVTRIQI